MVAAWLLLTEPRISREHDGLTSGPRQITRPSFWEVELNLHNEMSGKENTVVSEYQRQG